MQLSLSVSGVSHMGLVHLPIWLSLQSIEGGIRGGLCQNMYFDLCVAFVPVCRNIVANMCRCQWVESAESWGRLTSILVW